MSSSRPSVDSAVVQPDLSERPLRAAAERQMAASAKALFAAWTTEEFARWFAAPGTVLMRPEVNAPYFFEARFEGERHPHYGRFLELDPNRLIKLTWLTADGTRGLETVVTIQLSANEAGTLLQLTHEGLPDERSRAGHEEAWPLALELLDKALSTSKA